MRRPFTAALAAYFVLLLAACSASEKAGPTAVSEAASTSEASTSAPPTSAPPTSAPPTSAEQTTVPPTTAALWQGVYGSAIQRDLQLLQTMDASLRDGSGTCEAAAVVVATIASGEETTYVGAAPEWVAAIGSFVTALDACDTGDTATFKAAYAKGMASLTALAAALNG